MRKIDKLSIHTLEYAKTRFEDFAAQVRRIVNETNSNLEEIAEQAELVRDDAWNVLDSAVADAQDYFDARSEKWQNGDAGGIYIDWIRNIENARDSIGDTIDLEINDSVDDFSDIIDMLSDETIRSPEGE